MATQTYHNYRIVLGNGEVSHQIIIVLSLMDLEWEEENNINYKNVFFFAYFSTYKINEVYITLCEYISFQLCR